MATQTIYLLYLISNKVNASIKTIFEDRQQLFIMYLAKIRDFYCFII